MNEKIRKKTNKKKRKYSGTAAHLSGSVRCEAAVVVVKPQAFGRDGTVKPQAASAPLPSRGPDPARLWPLRNDRTRKGDAAVGRINIREEQKDILS